MTDADPLDPAVRQGSAPLVTRVMQCGVCGAPADRYVNRYECQANPAHMADLNTGLFSDHSYPEEPA